EQERVTRDDRDMPRWPAHADAGHGVAVQDVDGDDFVAAGVRDERVAGVRTRRGVARLVEVTLHASDAQTGAVDERDDTMRRVTDDGELPPDALDAPRSGSRGNRAQDLPGGKLDDGDT